MHAPGNNRRYFQAGISLLLVVLAVTLAGAAMAAPASNSLSQLLTQAENIKTSDNAGFVKLLHEIEGRTAELSDMQKWRLRYLQGWEATYSGQNDEAKSLLETVIKQAPDSG